MNTRIIADSEMLFNKNLLFLILIILNILDFYSTAILINLVGPEVEANPIVVWLFTVTGTFWTVFLVKGMLLALLGYGINHRNRGFLTDNVIKPILVLLNIGYIAVVMGNFHLIYIMV